MTASRNSSGSRTSDRSRFGGLAVLLLIALLAGVSSLAVWWLSARGYLLYYGDAEAHLNTARRIVDSRTPGYEQIGSPWLPVPHLLMLPLVGDDRMWRTGLAGAIPAAACHVLAALFLFLAVRRALADTPAALTAALVFATNPNSLYLGSIPMTEPVFAASLAALLYFTVRFQQTQSLLWAAFAALSSLAASLTRYEGWFLIPFVCLWLLLAGRRRWTAALLFGAIASLAPLGWLAHNWWCYSDPLHFYNGPYSALAIYRRALDQGMARYPGDHELGNAWLHFREAARTCAGPVFYWAGVAGIAAALFRRAFWPLAMLALPPVFYIWSIYSSGTPIFLPHLWPHSYYNSRYGLAALPLLALGAGAVVALLPARWRGAGALAVVCACLAPWLASPRPDTWVCWKESEVNSSARRRWTSAAAAVLKDGYRPGDGILTSFGDMTGILREAGIPLRQTLYDGNNPHWLAAVNRPDLFLWERWAVAVSGDPVSGAILKTRRKGPRYECVRILAEKGAPVIEIYRHNP